MLEGISRASGAGVSFELDGKTLKINGRLMEHYGEIEAELLRQRGDPISLAMTAISSQNMSTATEFTRIKRDEGGPVADDFLSTAKNLNDVAQRASLEMAYDKAKTWRNATGSEIAEWMNTFSGSCFVAWLAIRDNDPKEYTLKNVTTLLLKDSADKTEGEVMNKLHEAINQASAEDTRGNSTGPREEGQKTTGVELPSE